MAQVVSVPTTTTSSIVAEYLDELTNIWDISIDDQDCAE